MGSGKRPKSDGKPRTVVAYLHEHKIQGRREGATRGGGRQTHRGKEPFLSEPAGSKSTKRIDRPC